MYECERLYTKNIFIDIHFSTVHTSFNCVVAVRFTFYGISQELK